MRQIAQQAATPALAAPHLGPRLEHGHGAEDGHRHRAAHGAQRKVGQRRGHAGQRSEGRANRRLGLAQKEEIERDSPREAYHRRDRACPQRTHAALAPHVRDHRRIVHGLLRLARLQAALHHLERLQQQRP
eukprot:81080-Prymnesium_polylepis.1